MKILDIAKQEIGEIKNYSSLTVIVSLLVISGTLGRMPGWIVPLRYGALVGAAVYLITKGGKPSGLPLLILLYFGLTISIDHPAALFNPWGRYALFVIVFLLSSPLLQGTNARRFRYESLMVVAKSCVIISLISFVCYFLGISWMSDEEFLISGGLFSGITNQSNMLGPVCAIAIMYLANAAFTKREKMYWYILIPCALTLLFSACRAALLGALGGMVLLVYNYSKERGGFAKYVTTILLVGAVTFPLWNGALSRLEDKQERDSRMENTYGSREEKWGHRIEEFQSSPVTGIGFSAVDTKFGDDYMASGTTEPGSSWLAVLSMTGIIGFMMVMLLLWQSFKGSWKVVTERSPLICGLLVVTVLECMTEGFLLAGGSVLCYLTWLTMGCSFDNKYREKYG